MKFASIFVLFVSSFFCSGQTLISKRDVQTQKLGKLVYYKNYHDDFLDGHYNIADVFGNYTDVHFIKGLKDGKVVDYSHKGKVKQFFNFKKGILDGEYIMYHMNGKKFRSGNFVNGEKEGKFQYFDEDDEELVSETIYKKGKKEGKFWSRSYSNDKKFYDQTTGKYKNDEHFGIQKTVNQDGDILAETDYVNDDTYIKKIYLDNGKLVQVIRKKDAKLDGENLKYNQNGILRERVIYSKDVLVKYELFFENGKVENVTNYKDGKADGVYIEYKASGAKLEEGQYLKGYKSGVWKYYDSYSEELDREKTYENDILNGPFRTYNEANRIASEGMYKNGKIDGVVKYYNLRGKLTKEVTYDWGEETSVKTYTKTR